MADGALDVFAIDLDDDQHMDALSASYLDATIAWYQNDGNQNFNTRIIITSAISAREVFAIDLDLDGDKDVLSASYDDDKIAWYENDGSQYFEAAIISNTADGALDVLPLI